VIAMLASWNLSAQKNPGDLWPRDSIFFEYNTIPYVIAPSPPPNCWQVGHPSKTYFNEAYSIPLAIVTDTGSSYPVNSQSSFSFRIIDTLFGPPCGGATYFQFKHKFDTDTLQDYGYVEYSFDHGASWELAKDTNENGPYGFTWFMWKQDYSATSGQYYYHPQHISGHSDGWIVSTFIWQWYMPVKDSIIQFPDTIDVRFTFHSDNIQTNKEGWMIDNIVSGCMELGSGIPVQTDRAMIRISPVPITGESTVECLAAPLHSSFEIYDILGRRVFRKDILPNSTFSLSRNDFLPGLYLWICKSEGRVVQTGKLVVE
jgi:hypothetical protein